MLQRWSLALLVPVLLGFDGAKAREALDVAFHNLYGADVLAGVELAVEDGASISSIRYAYGRKHKGTETWTLLYIADGTRDAARALLLQHPGRPDRIFVSEGSRGRVRPISPGERGWPLFGSDFAYEDFRAQYADDYRIEVLGQDAIDGESCRVLRLRPLSGPYEKLIAWLSLERPVFLRIDYFDRKGLWKRYRADVDLIAQYFEWWVPMEDRMLDLRTGRRTTRRIRNILIDTPVPDDMFTTTRLARGRLPSF